MASAIGDASGVYAHTTRPAGGAGPRKSATACGYAATAGSSKPRRGGAAGTTSRTQCTGSASSTRSCGSCRSGSHAGSSTNQTSYCDARRLTSCCGRCHTQFQARCDSTTSSGRGSGGEIIDAELQFGVVVVGTHGVVVRGVQPVPV